MHQNKEHKRSNQLDTDKEVLTEVKESLTDIVDTIDESTLSLLEKDLQKILGMLSENDLHEVLKKLYKIAPEDTKQLAKEIEKTPGNNETILRGILHSIALTGFLPERFNKGKMKDILSTEIYNNDPDLLQELNKVEKVNAMLATRYRLQKILIGYYEKKNPNAPKFFFDDLDTSSEEDKLVVSEKKARTGTESLLDDYIIEYELGKERDYEIEELIYLGKKVLDLAKIENKKVPKNIREELQKYIEEYNSKSYNLLQISLDSKDPFSFHQFHSTNGLGVTYNFGYFNSDLTSNSEFFDLPKLDDKPVMLLLHGMLRDWAFWRNMIKTLIPYYQIIVPDMNGYGDSNELKERHTLENYAHNISKFIKELNVKNLSIMGHSLGSFTTQQILVENDLHTAKSVLFSSAPSIKLPTVLKLVGNLTKAFMFDFIGKTIPHIPSNLESVTSSHDIKMEKEDNYYKRVIKKSSSRAIAEAVKNIVFEYRFKSHKQPDNTKYMIVAAEKDKLISVNSTKKFLKFFPNAEYIELKNTGHDEVVNRFLEQKKDRLFQFLEIEGLE